MCKLYSSMEKLSSMWKYYKMMKSNEAKAQLSSDQWQFIICICIRIQPLKKTEYLYSAEYYKSLFSTYLAKILAFEDDAKRSRPRPILKGKGHWPRTLNFSVYFRLPVHWYAGKGEILACCGTLTSYDCLSCYCNRIIKDLSWLSKLDLWNLCSMTHRSHLLNWHSPRGHKTVVLVVVVVVNRGADYTDKHVCESVYLSVMISGNTLPEFTKFVCMLPMAMA